MPHIRVVIHGVTGKMGSQVLAAVCNEPDMEPVGAVDINIMSETLSLPDGSGTIPLASNLGDLLGSTAPRVMVDFTNASAGVSAALLASRHQISSVIGSSGIGDLAIAELEHEADKHGVGIIVAPNFAMGAVLLMRLASQAAPFFEYVDIIESHHEAKIDAPSGTALAMAKMLAQEGEFLHNKPEKEPVAGTRGGRIEGVGIHSLRMKGRSAHHEVVFGADGQTLTLRHDVLGRDCYMPGVLRAIRHVVDQKGLVVGLEKILGI